MLSYMYTYVIITYCTVKNGTFLIISTVYVTVTPIYIIMCIERYTFEKYLYLENNRNY